MGSDKPHKNISHNEFYHNDKSVFISFDIKYIMLVPGIVSGRKVSFQVSQISPLCFFSKVVPPFQCG